MDKNSKPFKVDLRVYQVGFGDCFLLTFYYKPKLERHVLIDFGSMIRPVGFGKSLMLDIANDIHARCTRPGSQLVAVVATHRHRDHISGFTTNASGTGTGDIIRACKPRLVIQPWTEQLDLATDARGPSGGVSLRGKFIAALDSMQEVAAAVAREARRPGSHLNPFVAKQLAFIGEDGIKNRSAVENLATMAPNRYVYFKKKSGLEPHLPGVKVTVLGPPTLEQSKDSIATMRSEDEDEFWHLQAAAGRTFTAGGARVFRGAEVYASKNFPLNARWLVRRLRSLRGDQLLQIVRELDDTMNNTSIILLFQVGRKKFLFPGDAQFENWAYALGKAEVRKLLAGTDLYKVGHHGSLNATPKESLWPLFKKRSDKPSPTRLKTVASTMTNNTHGSTDNDSEVPRIKLVNELKRDSDYFSTQQIKPGSGKFFEDIQLFP